MQFRKLEVIKDSMGDIAVKEGSHFHGYADSLTAAEHAEALLQNAESSGVEDVRDGLEFVRRFFLEILECYPTTRYAEAASRIINLIEDENTAKISALLATANKLAEIKQFEQNMDHCERINDAIHRQCSQCGKEHLGDCQMEGYVVLENRQFPRGRFWTKYHPDDIYNVEYGINQETGEREHWYDIVGFTTDPVAALKWAVYRIVPRRNFSS